MVENDEANWLLGLVTSERECSCVSYEPEGIFAFATMNGAGHTTLFDFDPYLGNKPGASTIRGWGGSCKRIRCRRRAQRAELEPVQLREQPASAADGPHGEITRGQRLWRASGDAPESTFGPDGIPNNRRGEPYPKVIDPRTGEPVPFPGGELRIVPKERRTKHDGIV